MLFTRYQNNSRTIRLAGFLPSGVSLKALLAAAPLDGIDLDRGHDLGREVDL
jgi:hypothetical protein